MSKKNEKENQKTKIGDVSLGGEKNMCLKCEKICHKIAETFGHQVNPVQLAMLIENSPLVKRN